MNKNLRKFTYPAPPDFTGSAFIRNIICDIVGDEQFMNIEAGEFKESTRTFVFEKGTIGNTHFLANPFNDPNKVGAIALINYILKVQTQASKYVPATWGDLPVLDNDKLSLEEKNTLASVELSGAMLPHKEIKIQVEKCLI